LVTQFLRRRMCKAVSPSSAFIDILSYLSTYWNSFRHLVSIAIPNFTSISTYYKSARDRAKK